MVNRQLIQELIEIDWPNFYEESYNVIDSDIIQAIL